MVEVAVLVGVIFVAGGLVGWHTRSVWPIVTPLLVAAALLMPALIRGGLGLDEGCVEDCGFESFWVGFGFLGIPSALWALSSGTGRVARRHLDRRRR